MFERLRKSKLMFWSLELLIIASLFYVFTQISFIFSPVATFFSTLFMPFLVAGFLYYILNPLVKLFVKFGIKRSLAVVLVILILLAAIVLLLLSFIPNLIGQLSSLAKSAPEFVAGFEKWLTNLASQAQQWPLFKEYDVSSYIKNIDFSFADIAQNFLNGLSSSLGSIVGTVASTAVVIFTAPFILFYMLKDGEKLVPSIKRFFPERHREYIVELLDKLNKTLSSYISGQAIECLFVGTFTFIGYLLIGVDYAFLFGVIAGLTNMIPYLGPYLGLAPAFLITVFNNPFQALLCCIVVLVVQQLDGNIIYPNVIGKSLQIHPLTIIIVLLVAGNLAGLLGVFLGVPVYAITRTIVLFAFEVVKRSRADRNKQEILRDHNN